MKNYTPIDRILLHIPKALREQTEDADLLMWALEAYNHLDIIERYEEVMIVKKVENFKVKLPFDAKELQLVTYLINPEIPEEASCEVSEEEVEEIDPFNLPSLSEMQQFVQSSFYNKRFLPLKYKGNSSSICCTCPTLHGNCPQYFKIDMNRNIVTSFKEGYVCLFYSRPIQDDNGNYLIIDLPEVIQYLAYYAQFMASQERLWRHEEGASNLFNATIGLADTYYLKALGTLRLRGLDANLIRSINFTNTPNQRLVRLPLAYFENSRVIK